jgi:hypothetical protein
MFAADERHRGRVSESWSMRAPRGSRHASNNTGQLGIVKKLWYRSVICYKSNLNNMLGIPLWQYLLHYRATPGFGDRAANNLPPTDVSLG